MTRVLVVDDQQLMRRGLRMLLSTVPDIEVVGEAADGREALARLRHDPPDVVLCDLRMPGMDGVEMVSVATARHPQIPILVLTTFDDDALVRRAMVAGAAGFLLKSVTTEDLAQAVRQVAAGGVVIDPAVARAALGLPGSRRAEAAPPDPLECLTAAELDVARLLADGETNREIAAHLQLAEGTVKNYVSSLLRKLDKSDRTRLALFLHDLLPPHGADRSRLS